MMESTSVAGCDLGKSTAKFVVGRIGPGPTLSIDSSHVVDHNGKPLEAFQRWYLDHDINRCSVLAATGLHADEIASPALGGLPEDACLEAALRFRTDLVGPIRVVSVGARGYAVLCRNEDGRFTHLQSDKCSSGTGETMVKTAARFGMTVGEADELALGADESVAITARCSVFAKSEMTHFGNQGEAADRLFKGYFESVARYVSALLKRAHGNGPIVLIGGGSRIGALVKALKDGLGGEVICDPFSMTFEALGACQMAFEHHVGGRECGLPVDAALLVQPKERRFRVLNPAKHSSPRVVQLESPRWDKSPSGPTPVVLGLDLGSTGSKAVLADISSGEPVLDVYDRTRGNPVEAAKRLVHSIRERMDPDIRAIAVTGSGREAVATILRAAYPDDINRIVVMNEIIAHAAAAIRCDEKRGAGLSVVEIGGQDAKFIQIAGGHIVESDMNKACSAGTGSFLEEQAVFYGVHDIREFGRIAAEAKRPPDLGQMCTVFVAEAAAEAHNQGFEVSDLFAGFMYSVIHNYINRVMGSRTFGDRIFFQGKPASNPVLAWTLAAVTGREVIVPSNPGAMGAWGSAISGLQEMKPEDLRRAGRLDTARFLAAEMSARSEFQCRDPKCETLCRIEKNTVAVAGSNHTVFAGGACPKFEVSSLGKPKLPIDAPSAFDAREAILARHLDGSDNGSRPIGIPAVGPNHTFLHWMVTLLREWGLSPRVLRSDARSLSRGEERCYSYDACAPVKIAHGVADAEVETLFFPKILAYGDREGPGGVVCPMEQAMPEMVERSLQARGRSTRVIRPILDLRKGLLSVAVLGRLLAVARSLGIPHPRALRGALEAARVQREYEKALSEIGERTLSYGRKHGIPVVVICGSLHVVHDRAINAGIPGILRQNGALPLPVDCYPIPDGIHHLPKVPWADANRSMRVALACRARGDAFPLLLSSFGCGPASFAEHVFDHLMTGYPHTALETDGHGGAAGYVTRAQAFLHAVRSHGIRPIPIAPERLAPMEATKETTIRSRGDSRFVVFSMADRFTSIMAATYRSFGIDAVASGPNSASTLALGRRDCSGKECIPYQLIWGAFRDHLEKYPPRQPTVLFQVYGEGMCRNCMFIVKDKMALERLGLGDRVSVRDIRPDAAIRSAFLGKLWTGVVAWDLIGQLAAYYRAIERDRGDSDRLYERLCDELQVLLEGSGINGGFGAAFRGYWKDLLALLDRASAAFADIAARARPNGEWRTVLLSGDIYVRLDEFGSDGLVRKLNALGLSVLMEPASTFVEYLVSERSAELVRLPTGRVQNLMFKYGTAATRRRLYGRMRERHPWLPMPDPRGIRKASHTVLDRHPLGEAPVTIGSVLHHWNGGHCDGVAIASPWGCGPALISESLLRHQAQIPMLVVYNDGLPIDERRLRSFAFRLQRQPPRAG
ncbi:MAG: hypothetical protein HYT87_07230 [Nitrospirae bacterium]|nr:hypothetical protein [Nitrospirota bacterium]